MNMNMTQTMPEIESKNLTIICDQLKHEAHACKKSEVYSNYFTDPGLKNLASQVAQHHRQNFDNLMNYLDSHR
ncbi:MAG: hypothetical protein ACOYJD_00885 [Christensenellales bacterium]|jgi:hypothetical protein